MLDFHSLITTSNTRVLLSSPAGDLTPYQDLSKYWPALSYTNKFTIRFPSYDFYFEMRDCRAIQTTFSNYIKFEKHYEALNCVLQSKEEMNLARIVWKVKNCSILIYRLNSGWPSDPQTLRLLLGSFTVWFHIQIPESCRIWNYLWSKSVHLRIFCKNHKPERISKIYENLAYFRLKYN